MNQQISSASICKWLTAWSLSRELPLPVAYKSGLKVDVGYSNQKARYVFAQPNADFIALANTITEPWVFLKVCASPPEVPLLPERWVLQPQGYMMTCPQPMSVSGTLAVGYTLVWENYDSTHLITILAPNGEVASNGRVVLVDDLAVYDRITTAPHHRRKGLARFLMKELEKIAVSNGATAHFLVATEEGRLLYGSLGWEVYCLYTSFVIPGRADK